MMAFGAGPVLDDERLAERLGHVLRDDARDHVGRPARSESDQDLRRLRGIALCGRRARERARRCSGERRDVFSSFLTIRDRTSSPSLQRLTRRCSPGP